MTSYTEEYLTNCVMYILSKKQNGWTVSHESFYNEFDFICHARHEKDILSDLEPSNSLQRKALLHREKLN